MSSNSSPAASMMAVTTIGIGGYEKLVYGAVPLPRVSPGDVLLRVLAAGVNNTDINTRVGWYSPSVKDEIAAALGPFSVDVIIDNVAGVGFGDRVDVLKRGGRLVTSGAIAGPIVTLDLRTVYLRDLRLIGCTAWDAAIFPNLIGYIERGELQPPRVKVFPLESIADAQREFLDKLHTGKLVLVPPLAAS